MQDARFAAIDLGSNSFHLIIATVKRDGHYRILARHRQKVRLADGFDKQLVVSEEAIQRGLDCLNQFATLLQDIPRERVLCVATATLRKAANSHAMLTRLEHALGYNIQVISGETEAELIYQGATQHLLRTQQHVLVLDIGGASTEIIVGRGCQPDHLVSLDMGCVTWQNRFFPEQHISEAKCAAAIAAAKATLEPHRKRFLAAQWQHVCGASGTFRTLYDMRKRPKQPITLSWLHEVLSEVIGLGDVKNLGELGIRGDRQPVFVGGLCILIALFESLTIAKVDIAKGALREGLLIRMLTQPNSPFTS
ncbi:Ppx/GppA phosphatase family protein [Pseudidiomarina woesei]|uniref:Ppx/GppA phosphatase family n=1 Tax=Pseudidiomarina woesei TaxID=1381080 RepID=A0A0K6H3U5_9GAMM|nr:Ppx/GppA phosphatase family protein [Pseudidiomarina woesei]CUA85653.1 Ppx/GppA phosphatase family [Pseudidiomarina woesei]